jgi:hypothetical protein
MATPISGTTNFCQVVNGAPLAYQFNTVNGALVANTAVNVPGLYGQGNTILDACLLGTGATKTSYFRVEAYGNNSTNGVAAFIGTLYSSLGTSGRYPGSQLGSALPKDAWLVMTPTDAADSTDVGLSVSYTNLRSVRPSTVLNA